MAGVPGVRAPANRSRLERLLKALSHSLHGPVRLYLVGGSVLVDLGLREATLDVDYVARSEDPAALQQLEQALPRLKEQLNVNVEPASPEDFMPVPAGALDRSTYVRSYGPVSVYYYHLPSLVLAKVARSAERDLADVALLVKGGHVDWEDVEAAWREVRLRASGWLRHTPTEVERRMAVVRRQLGVTAPSEH